jgi:hypothetical protein
MTVRKIAREGVIFMLMGPIVAAPVIYGFLHHDSVLACKTRAADTVYAAIDYNIPGHEFHPANTVDVPLTDGTQLRVTDCTQAHPLTASDNGPWNKYKEGAPLPDTLPADFDFNKKPVIAIPAGASNGSDCMYFSVPHEKEVRDLGGHLSAVPLGDVNQIEIEKQYWTGYKEVANERRSQDLLVTGFFSLWGFPAGVGIWLFYRLIRFAVKG